MKELYWLTRVSEFDSLFRAIWFISIICVVVMLVMYFFLADEFKEDTVNKIKKAAILSSILLVVGALGDAFTPSRRDVLLIYGLGTTIDYINSDDKAKQLPDKAVDALTRYLDAIGAGEAEEGKSECTPSTK